MKNTLFILDNPSSLIRIVISVFFSIMFVTGTVKAQSNIDDNTKKILYLSLVIDEVSLNSYNLNNTFDLLVNNVEEEYKDFEYETSGEIAHNFSTYGNPSHIYFVQLYKLKNGNPYYVLRFNSSKSLRYKFFDDLWIRISGYSVSDLKVFFDKLIEMGMTMEKLKTMVAEWQEKDTLFKELDWGCLLEGYEKNDTQQDCYISNVLSGHKAACLNCKHEVTDIYAIFSKIILKGHLDFNIN